MLAATSGGDASRIVINAEDIRFEENDRLEGDKIRRLGPYVYGIHFKDTSQSVRRKVVVLEQQTL